LLVIDDLHYGVETAQFRTMLAIMLRELPEDLQCACISRTLPPDELAELTFKGQLTVPRSIDPAVFRCRGSGAGREPVAKPFFGG
jgi:hypothetical protein